MGDKHSPSTKRVIHNRIIVSREEFVDEFEAELPIILFAYAYAFTSVRGDISGGQNLVDGGLAQSSLSLNAWVHTP